MSFVCPVCGEDVPDGAPACPECGADDETGWSEDDYLDGVDLPDPEPAPAAGTRGWVWWVALLLVGWIAWSILHGMWW